MIRKTSHDRVWLFLSFTFLTLIKSIHKSSSRVCSGNFASSSNLIQCRVLLLSVSHSGGFQSPILLFLDGLMYRTDITLKVVDNALLNFNGKLLFLRFDLRSVLSTRVNGAYIELLKDPLVWRSSILDSVVLYKFTRSSRLPGLSWIRAEDRTEGENDSMSIPSIFRYDISLTVNDGFLINKSQITVMWSERR